MLVDFDQRFIGAQKWAVICKRGHIVHILEYNKLHDIANQTDI